MPDDLGDLKTRIQSETLRDDLADVLANDLTTAILKSIDHYEWERWWFNEGLLTVPSVVNSMYVSIDPSILRIDVIRAVIGGVRYRMTERQVDWIMAAYSTPSYGQPTEWAMLGDQILIYPTPNQPYPLLMEIVQQAQPVIDGTDDTVSNTWTTTGQDLIVARTKLRLYRDYLSATAQDPRISNAMAQEDEAYTKLRSQSNRRIAVGRIEPAW
jgi:hypothetical protein